MKKTNFKRIIACLLAALTLSSTLVACTENYPPVETTPNTSGEETTMFEVTEAPTEAPTEEETDPPVTEPPMVSLELLTFTPASPTGQILTEKGHSPQILITNYNETAIDALGRVLPTSAEAGLPKEGKYVGLFYSLWTVGSPCAEDNSKVMARNPYNPNFGARWQFCWWAEPETGYHRGDDVWQIKRDMYYFAMAGVDFLYFDMTNGYLYEEAMEVFLDTCLEMRAEGQMTPYIVPWCFGTAVPGNGDTGGFYEKFMTQEKYKDLWFHWEGKPLAMIKPLDDGTFPILDDEYYADKLTFRKAWVSPEKYSKMYWEDNRVVNFGYGYGWIERSRYAECTGIGCAGFANFGHGRSGALSNKDNLNAFWETDTMGQGLVFEDAFNQVMTNNPECQVLLISRWNEWVAQNFTDPADKGTDTGFVDQFNAEFSRDIEPMKGGFTDNYFYQMCSIIRRFKGVLPADGVSGAHTMSETDADVFEKWEDICPVYTDFEGDTSHRDHSDTTGKIQYVNTTGRNDIVESRISADGGNLYVYARTAKALTSPTDSKNWMLLFIDADADKSTGWEGYDFMVNYEVVSNTVTTICAYKDGVWQEIGTVAYAVKGDRVTITIPRSLLGLTDKTVKVNFHWMDNVTDVYDLESWFTTGDSAPERRNNYVYEQAIRYTGKGETILPARESDTVKGMPALSLSDEVLAEMNEGLRAALYPLVENYPAQPDFRLIDSLLAGSQTVKTLTVDGLAYSKNVGVVYEGYIRVAETRSYEFELSYDDGAKLFIDGRLVVDGSYDPKAEDGVKTAKGEIILEEGYHAIRVEYVELKGGNAHLSLKGDVALLYSDYGMDIEELPSWTVDMTIFSGQKGYGTESHPQGFYSPYMYLEYNFTAHLGVVDLSKYSRVEIVYCCDGSDITKQQFEASSSLAIGLKSENSSYGHGKTDNFSGDIAHTNMVFENLSWAMGARAAVVDLSDVDYNGDVWVAVHNPAGTFIAILEIRFYE
ncbi:MAG: hypothetical protein J6D87_07030 [Clostridia bacterium]|nr:hypothetical protein [Clostridia bacterium]